MHTSISSDDRHISSDDGEYSEHADLLRMPRSDGFLVEGHRVTKFTTPYHHHASVEINFLGQGEMIYSFHGHRVTVLPRQMIVFWGALPHCVVDVCGEAAITNIYIDAAQFLNWNLPTSFIRALVGGDVISARYANCGTGERTVSDRGKPDLRRIDEFLFSRWAREYRVRDPAWRRLIRGEIEMRIKRTALEGWDTLRAGRILPSDGAPGQSAMDHIEAMLRFMASNFAAPITVNAVANAAELSPSYAMTLFKRTVGISIKEYITQIRLSHAQMLLANSDSKIVSIAMDSGFGSLSSFYLAFCNYLGGTPAAFRSRARKN